MPKRPLPKRPKRDPTRRMAAKVLVLECVRNSRLENLHAGTFPSSKTGDWSDVKVVSPYGEIPWTELSRISDAEMRELMIDIVNRVYTALRHGFLRPPPTHWEDPVDLLAEEE